MNRHTHHSRSRSACLVALLTYRVICTLVPTLETAPSWVHLCLGRRDAALGAGAGVQRCRSRRRAWPRCIPLLPRDAGEPAGAAVPAAAAAAEGQGRCCDCAGRPPQQVGSRPQAWRAVARDLHFVVLHSVLVEVSFIVGVHMAGWHMHTVASLACSAPHFSRSLEWLLFTALEANADGPAPAQQPQSARYACRSVSLWWLLDLDQPY